MRIWYVLILANSSVKVNTYKIDFTTMPDNKYSTDEINTGKKWINGKTIFQKSFVMGGLGRATTIKNPPPFSEGGKRAWMFKPCAWSLSLFIRFRNSNVSNDQSSYIFANCHIQLGSTLDDHLVIALWNFYVYVFSFHIVPFYPIRCLGRGC